MDTDLCFTPATDLAQAIRARRLSPRELLATVLAEIARVSPTVNAVVTLVPDQAEEAARTAEDAVMRGAALGPLHGIPLTIKDTTATRGIRTTYGFAAYVDHVPQEDALIVERLRRAGAVIIGKTNAPELGAGANTTNRVFGATRNPWRPDRTCGGSSGGAAVALATGMGPLAQGSDTGGSLRIPASCCGVIGFRTSPGLIPLYPAPFLWDRLSVTGPMARTVADTALMLAAVAGPDDRAAQSFPVDPAPWFEAVRAPDVRGWRIAWSADLGLTPVEPEVVRVAEAAARTYETLGAHVEDGAPEFGDVRETIYTTRGARMAATRSDLLDRWREEMFPPLVADIEHGLSLSAAQWGRAEMALTALWHRVRRWFETHDLLVTPTLPMLPFPLEWDYPHAINGQPLERYVDWFVLTYAVTLTGLPAISIPAGWSADGLPVGLQLVGPPRGETAVLRAAAALEAVRPWAQRRPPVVANA